MVRTMIPPEILGRPKSLAGALTCPVAEDGSWSAELPAGKLDIAVSSAGFMPHYAWAVELPPHGAKELPAFELRTGASVAAWVAIEGGKIDPENCTARLVPATQCGLGAGQGVRNQARAVETRVGGDGFVQFTDLAPGHYALEVRHPGYATASAPLLEVVARRETFLPEPILLKPPLTLQVEIVPSTAPTGEPWRVRVYSYSNPAANGGRPETVYNGLADREGRFAVSDLSAGEYSVDLDDEAGNRIYDSSSELGPWKLETSTSQRIEIPLVRIEGRLTLGEEPVAATLRFGGKSGSPRVRLESDAEGRFTGSLPREGHWPVAIQAEEPHLDTMTTVTIRPDSDGATRADIALPDTRIFGRVLDSLGQPLVGASVFALTEGNILQNQVETDTQGAFEFRALPEGKLTVAAHQKRSACQAGPHRAILAEGMEIGPIQLRCQEMRQVRGVVVSARGPVAGALVRMNAQAPTIGSGEAVSGQDGAFAFDFPAQAQRATVHLRASGFGAQQQEVVLGKAALRLTLKEGIGEVAIQNPFTDDDLSKRQLRLVLFAAGVEVSLAGTTVRTYPAANDELARLEVGQLAPNDYSACYLLPSSTLPGWSPSEEPVTCASGRLEAGGRLVLSPPRPKS